MTRCAGTSPSPSSTVSIAGSRTAFATRSHSRPVASVVNHPSGGSTWVLANTTRPSSSCPRWRRSCRPRARRRSISREPSSSPMRRATRSSTAPSFAFARLGRTVSTDGTGPPGAWITTDLPRRRARRGQDVRHARRGLASPHGAPTSSSASSRPTAGSTRPRRSSDLEVVPRRTDRPPRRRLRRWTSTPCWPAAPRWPWSTSWPTPTCPAPATRSGGRTSRAARRRHRRHHDGQRPAPGVAQRRGRADHRGPPAETVPDEIVRAADQVELVDMTPEALRRRMAHGNIYGPETGRRRARQLLPAREPGGAARARPAVARRPGRRRASQDYREDHGITDPWETRERVVVA